MDLRYESFDYKIFLIFQVPLFLEELTNNLDELIQEIISLKNQRIQTSKM